MAGSWICIHGHFYQPPRENPWLELIEMEDSSAPYHDWNERICAECYGPNAHARIVESSGRVKRMINNYAWISFNFGPTLLSWLERHAPKVLSSIQEADRASLERCQGHGNAIAQAYNHTILPLASRRDKSLQVEWGIEAFAYYFKRMPEGMWLPETAADVETLEVLAEQGIRFTVLSPSQALRVKPPYQGWISVTPASLDTRRAYECRLPSGREIALFFYDGEVAQEVAFQRLLTSGEDFFQRVMSRFDSGTGPQLVHIATDGETYGHHHRFGEMALAYLIKRAEENPHVRMTNYGEFLSLEPPAWEAEIHEKRSWSCAHGVERWRSNCGCRVSGPELQQKWRAPLRRALDDLKGKLDRILEVEGQRVFQDPWAAFRGYVRVLLDRKEETLQAYLNRFARQPLTETDASLAAKLMEMERHGQLMFTSCAWFFDEISGVEAVQILRLAARAIQLAELYFGVSLEEDFLEVLEQAPSNLPEIRDGRRLWEKEVRPAVTSLERVLAHFTISSIFRKDLPSHVGLSYSLKESGSVICEAGNSHLAVGAAEVFSKRTLQRGNYVYAVIHFDGLDLQFFWRPFTGSGDYETLKKDLVRTFEEGSLGDLYQELLRYFHKPTHRLSDLFRDEQRRIIQTVLSERLSEYQALGDQLFDHDSALLKRLGALRYPIPAPMKMVAQFSTESRMRKILEEMQGEEDLEALSTLAAQARSWGYRPDPAQWERYLVVALEQRMETLRTSDRVLSEMRKAELILSAARILELSLNLWRVQNAFIEVCRSRLPIFEVFKEEVQSFASTLYLDTEALPLSLR
ncbi:MAG: DUF3536 domain-containing protein [bacterium]